MSSGSVASPNDKRLHKRLCSTVNEAVSYFQWLRTVEKRFLIRISS